MSLPSDSSDLDGGNQASKGSLEETFGKSAEELAKETIEFSQREQLETILKDLFRRAHKAKTNHPLNFVAEEIYRMGAISPRNAQLEQLSNLRKIVGRMQSLFEHLKARDSPHTATPEDQEKFYQDYVTKHDLRQQQMRIVSYAYISANEKNPLNNIADVILEQPNFKMELEMEMESLEKRQKIITKLVQCLIDKNPLSLQEIQDFSSQTVKQEHAKEHS